MTNKQVGFEDWCKKVNELFNKINKLSKENNVDIIVWDYFIGPYCDESENKESGAFRGGLVSGKTSEQRNKYAVYIPKLTGKLTKDIPVFGIYERISE